MKFTGWTFLGLRNLVKMLIWGFSKYNFIGEEQHGIQKKGDKVDDISNLPDCILHHILSLIPTKDAVRTSILSKRWNNVWTSVSNLDFDDALGPRDPTGFINFVDRVIELRNASDIEQFHLSCHVCVDATKIHIWISNAIMHNVHELDLSLSSDESFMLPHSMFSSTSLKTLKIEAFCDLILPNSISIPNLKILHLLLVTFSDEESTQNLFSGCPVLEELVIVDCKWADLKYICFSSSTLKRLTIEYFMPPDDPNGCEITVDASNLLYFKSVGYLSYTIFLYDVSSLVEAYINVMGPHEGKNEVADHVAYLLEGLRNIRSLTVCSRTIKYLVTAGICLPVFNNLTHLELSSEIGNSGVEALMTLLNQCPNLQSLYFDEGFKRNICLTENGLIRSSVPKCMSFCLKTLTIKNFHGIDSDICFLKWGLKHALVLEKINVHCCVSLLGNPNRQKKVKMALGEAIASGSASLVLSNSLEKGRVGVCRLTCCCKSH